MVTWEPKQKQYPHFDAPLSKRSLRRLVSNQTAVAHHSFFPFLRFVEEWQPFRGKPGQKKPKPKRKSRTIRYASRRDSAIFSYYRAILSDRYEQLIKGTALDGCILAYRRIPNGTGSGKSNINFAREAFKKIQCFDSCVVLALDISSFFESLDHERLNRVWCDLLKEPTLPPDHAHVFENITHYADVPHDDALVRLDIAEWKTVGTGKKLAIKMRPIPIQLCTPSEFREKIAGRGGIYPKLIERNQSGCGVPQGAPLSDLLANAYLYEFDRDMLAFVEPLSGSYMRYSDDILIVIPTEDEAVSEVAENFAIGRISAYGSSLRIKPEKTSAYIYRKHEKSHTFRHLREKGRNGLEYLGFRFDGVHAHIRASTLSRLHRNIVLGARGAAHRHVARYTGKPLEELQRLFNIGNFMQRYGRVEDFDPTGNPRNWTFWTYATRAITVFGSMGSPIERQLARYRTFVSRIVTLEIDRAYASRK